MKRADDFCKCSIFIVAALLIGTFAVCSIYQNVGQQPIRNGDIVYISSDYGYSFVNCHAIVIRESEIRYAHEVLFLEDRCIEKNNGLSTKSFRDPYLVKIVRSDVFD